MVHHVQLDFSNIFAFVEISLLKITDFAVPECWRRKNECSSSVLKQNWGIALQAELQIRTYSSRIRTACFSDSGRGSLSNPPLPPRQTWEGLPKSPGCMQTPRRQTPPVGKTSRDAYTPLVNRQTPVKTLPWPILRLWAVIKEKLKRSKETGSIITAGEELEDWQWDCIDLRVVSNLILHVN